MEKKQTYELFAGRPPLDGWHFPLINPVKQFDLQHYLDKVGEEVKEFQDAKTTAEMDKEAIDILHAAETFVRKYCITMGVDFESVKNAVIRKNEDRGYYRE